MDGKTIYILLFVIAFIFCLFMIWRNHQVYNYLLGKIETASALSKALIDKGNPDYMLPFAIFKSVKYNDMLRQWWRPLSSFYKGTILEDKTTP